MDVPFGDQSTAPRAADDDNPTTPAKGVKKTEYSCQTKRIVQCVHNFIVKRRSLPGFANTQRVTAEACGISLRTVQRISRENKITGGRFSSPRTSISSAKPKTGLDDFDKDMVRRIIYDLYDRGEFPTTQKVHDQLREEINYQGSARSVLRIIHDIGFAFIECNGGGRHVLIEQSDKIGERLEFLRKMNAIREQTPEKPIFYLGEKCVRGTKNPNHIVLLHIGSAKTGFIPKLLYKNTKKVSATHGSVMNADIFEKWFKNMLTALPESSVIVMDNAGHHSTEINRAPSMLAPREHIENWLTEKNISFSPEEIRAELLIKVEANNKKRVYVLDKEALELGHEVVRIPPGHGQYNPIELVWAQIQDEVDTKKHTLKIADVEKLTHEAIENVTTENWRRYVEYAEKLQKEDIARETVRGIQLDRIAMMINLKNDHTECGLSDDICIDDDEF